MANFYTRKQYLKEKCDHHTYYSQYVDEHIKRAVIATIGLERIMISKDESFNDIPLKLWDNVLKPFPKSVGDKMRELGDFPTMAGAVCIAKAAARQIVEERLVQNELSRLS